MLNTKLTNSDGDLPVMRVNTPDHFPTEEDAAHLYVSKAAQQMANKFRAGQGDVGTSMQPRIQLPYVEDNSVRNHAVVVVTTSAALIDRQRSWKQLHTMATTGKNECAIEMLEGLDGFVIE